MKMTSRAHDIRKYRFSNGENLLLDTNIWIYLHPLSLNEFIHSTQKIYTDALKSMRPLNGDLQQGGSECRYSGSDI